MSYANLTLGPPPLPVRAHAMSVPPKSTRGSTPNVSVYLARGSDGEQLLEILPKEEYSPFFVADRFERFGGDMCVIWLPGQDSEAPNYTPVYARSKETGRLVLPALTAVGWP